MTAIDPSRAHLLRYTILRQRGRWSRLQLALLSLLVLSQIADLASFPAAIGTCGVGAEQNPLARAVYTQAGLAGLTALKITAVCVMLALIVRFFPRERLSTGLLVLLVAFSSVGAISNVSAYNSSPRLYGAVGHLGDSLKPPGDRGCGDLCLEGPR